VNETLPERFRTWFASRGWRPRRHQLEMVEKARAGRDVLLIAPTGGGKTLSGFLPSLVELDERGPRNDAPALHTLYLSPLKALATDVERNLLTPVREMNLPVAVEARTGDTPQSKKARQRVTPPDVLLTTPEQLALFCAWEGARDWFADLRHVIVDEIHAIHGSKRGDLLNLGLARLQSFAPNLRRVGLSATVNDPDMLRRWLSPQPGSADLVLGDPGAPAVIDVWRSSQRVPWSGWTARHALGEVYELIKTAKTALVFVNTRFQAETAFQALWELNTDGLPIALHHGSLSVETRRRVEAAMARGELRAVVCTSTLDLGIDWGAVDLVVQLAAPKGSARLVQRIGRANHRLDEPSRALLVPAHRFEWLECECARQAVEENDLDGEPERDGGLDVLAQHVMGVGCSEPFDPDALYAEVRSAAPYRRLSRALFDEVIGFVSTGGYALGAYDRFKRLVRTRDGKLKARTREIVARHRMNVGAIVDVGTLNVVVAASRGPTRRGGRKVGEMEEGFIQTLAPGDTFLFGGTVWRFEGVEGVDAFVAKAPPGSEPRVPSWAGSKFAMSTYLARRVRRMIADAGAWATLPGDVQEWLEIQRARSVIPDPDEMLLETFRRGRRHYLVAYPFDGRITHGTLCHLLARRLERAGRQPLGFVANDYALAVWAMKPMGDLDPDDLFQQDLLGDDLEAWLDESFMMKRTFRQCALISGLIEKNAPGRRDGKTGRQVTVSSDLIYDVLRSHQPDHILLRAARADAATGLLDVKRLGLLLGRIKGRIRHAPLPRVSPFAVPVLLEIGREPVTGAAWDAILEENADELIAEALELGDRQT
jgi:ATP-dependent Lhr-like helicase